MHQSSNEKYKWVIQNGPVGLTDPTATTEVGIVAYKKHAVLGKPHFERTSKGSGSED